MPAFAAAPAPAAPAAAAARLIIRKEVRSATGVVSYKVIDTAAGHQVTQTTSRAFGCWLKPGAVPSANALRS